MNFSSLRFALVITVCMLTTTLTWAGSIHGINRLKCENRNALQKYQDGLENNEFQKRVEALRNEMRIRTSLQGPEIDAYIVSSFDEHQSQQIDDTEKRLEFISGFTGPIGDAVITLKSAALWTDSKYLELADRELDCEWKIFAIGEEPTIAMWLAKQIPTDSFVGADPKIIPHQLWHEWDRELSREFLRLMKVNRNLIDIIWGDERPLPRDFSIKTHNSTFSGVSWLNKTEILREHLRNHRCDAMVVNSLTEIAYLLNLRGSDIRFVPVFKSYLIVSHKEVILYTNRSKVSLEVQVMFNFDFKTNACVNEKCVMIKNYHDIWRDLRTLSQQWKRVLLPSLSVFDMGASEAIYSSVNREIVLERISPIVYMRARKNDVEREGMRRAHIRDAVAMSDTLSYLEERYLAGDQWTETMMSLQTDRSRHEQDMNQGLSFKTITAFGANAAKPYYHPTNYSNAEITNDNLLLVDSGGQYLDGTTAVARTIHLGTPTQEQKRAYTNVLTGLIRLSMLVFPDSLKPAEVDSLIRGPLWSAKQDYPHLSGHGIGSYLSVEESPINIAYTTKHKYTFKDGYFFSVAPGYYKTNSFGIRLKSVLEVIDTKDRHYSGAKFLAFKVATLVPFETKLIDTTLLSVQEKKWLNQYNSRIRDKVGDELKRQFKMPAFYWLMNQTEHIREYLPESEYRFAQKASISYISPPQVKNSTEEATFNCTVVKPDEINVSWYKDGQMLTLGNINVFNNPRYRSTHDTSSNTYSLHIQNLTASDSGTYSCLINLGFKESLSKEVDLQVTRPPQIVDAQEINVHVSEGQMAILLCTADGYPKPEITWKRDNEDIFFSKTHTYSGANLTILQVKKEDRGRYICEASNGIGDPARKNVLLEVDFSPVMSAKRPKVGQKEGYEAELICKVTAYPPAAISWIRHEKLLNNNEHYEISHLGVSNEETTSTLKLMNVAKHHFGDYHCKAENKNGVGETRLELFESEIPVYPFKF